MNVKELIDFTVARSKVKGGGSEVTQKQARHCISAMIEAVGATLHDGGSVAVAGLGVFAAGRRAARVGRNPQTGATIRIPAQKIPKFTASKTLKDSLQ